MQPPEAKLQGDAMDCISFYTNIPYTQQRLYEYVFSTLVPPFQL